MAAITVTKADVRPLPGAVIEKYPAAGALSLGDAVYLDSNGKVEKADADAAASMLVHGIVVSAPRGGTDAVADDMVDVCVAGRVTGFSGMTIGSLAFLSVTAGKVDHTAPAAASGDFRFIVGIAVSAVTLQLLRYTNDFAAQ